MKKKPSRKTPPKRSGTRMSFQISKELDQLVRQEAEKEFQSVTAKGRLSSFLRKVILDYLTDKQAENEAQSTATDGKR